MFCLFPQRVGGGSLEGGGQNGSHRHFFFLYPPHLYSAVKQGLDAVLRVGNSGRELMHD